MSILYITAGARRPELSVSRRVGEAFVRAAAERTGEPITRLDLAVQPMPRINAAVFASENSFFSQKRSGIDVTVTDFYAALTAQLFSHTRYVFVFPGCKHGVPPALAQYLLGTMREGKTFERTAGRCSGLLRGKRAMLICSGAGACSAACGYGAAWVSGMLAMSGVRDRRTLFVEENEETPFHRERSLERAIAEAKAAAKEF